MEAGWTGWKLRCVVTDDKGNKVISEEAIITVAESKYTITFDANGGYWDDPSVTTKTYEVEPDQLFTNYPSGVKHKTLVFNGWYFDKACTNKVGVIGFYPDGDMTVYAGWAEKVTVTFDANGGKVGNNKDVLISEIAKGSIIENMPIPTRTGDYSFIGWALAKDATEDEVIDFFHYPFNEDTYLYAIWSDGYTITYDANGGRWSDSYVIKQYNVKKGESLGGSTYKFPGNPSWEDKAFTGWYHEKEAKNKIEYIQGYVPTASEVLYAGWTEDYYTITLIAENGTAYADSLSGETVRIKVPKDFSINISTTAVKDGCSFAGWSYSSAAATVDLSANQLSYYIPSGDITLYAVFGEPAKITLKGNGGLFYDGSDSVNLVGTIGQVCRYTYGDPVREGYCFTGWSLTQDATEAEISSLWSYVPKNPTQTLYAVWEKAVDITAPTLEYDVKTHMLKVTIVASQKPYISIGIYKDGHLGNIHTYGQAMYDDEIWYDLMSETIESGVYKFVVKASQNQNDVTNFTKGAVTYTGEYTYVAPEQKLATPTNLKWKGKIATWDAVSSADRYLITVYTTDGREVVNSIAYGNSYEFNWLADDMKYQFTVRAVPADADEYAVSEVSEKSPEGGNEEEVSVTAPEVEYDEINHTLKVTVSPDEKPYVSIGIYQDGALKTTLSYGQITNESGTIWFSIKNETKESGVYQFAVKASQKQYDNDFSRGAVTFTKEYTYTAPDKKLDTPTNLHWDGKIAVWSAVPYATNYQVKIFNSSGNIAASGYVDGNVTSYDTSWLRDSVRYQFTVTAIPNNLSICAASDESEKSPVYGEATEELYNVTFHAGDGAVFEGTSQNVMSRTQEKGSKIENAPKPVKSGYFLVGWSLTENGSLIDLSTYTVESDVDLYAIMGKQVQPASITYDPNTKSVTISSDPSNHYYIALRITSESQGVVHEHYFGQVPESGSITYDVSEYVTDATTYTFKTFTDESEEGAKRFGGVWSETQYTNDIVTTKLDTPTGLYWGMNALANWNAVENADRYEVTLYKNGVKTDTSVTTSDLNADFFTVAVGEENVYTFTVKAVSSDETKYVSSEESAASSEYQGRKENETPIIPLTKNQEEITTEAPDESEVIEPDNQEEIADDTEAMEPDDQEEIADETEEVESQDQEEMTAEDESDQLSEENSEDVESIVEEQ